MIKAARPGVNGAPGHAIIELVMRNASGILSVVLGLAFLAASVTNVALVGRSRAALAGGALSEKATALPARFHVIVVIPDTDDSFFEGLLEGIRSGEREADAAVQVFRYPGSSPAEAERLYELALRSKADGLVMYAPRNDRVTGRAREAAARGVSLVPVGTDPPLGGAPLFIGSSSYQQGREGGELILERLGDSARIGVILPASGAAEAPAADPRHRGLADAIQRARGATIVAAVRSRQGALSGEDAVAAMLRANPSINAIFCPTARDTVGAAQVVIDLNLVGQVVVIGADETPEIARYLDKGVVAASIVRDTKRMGAEAMRMFSRLEAGEDPRLELDVGFATRTSQPAPAAEGTPAPEGESR